MMNKKTQQTLTVVGVGVLAFFGVRYLMKRSKGNGVESKSNFIGRPVGTTGGKNDEWCWNGTRWVPSDATTLCDNPSTSSGDFAQTVYRAKSKFSRADGAPCGCNS